MDIVQTLPELTEGEELPINKLEIVAGKTKPKPLYTDATLLAAMETASRQVEDGPQREAIKECGLGTPATRAGMIELIINREYVRREKKSLIPTEKGLQVYQAIKDQPIADVEMTALWETALQKIETGEVDSDTFRRSIESYTHQITREVLKSKLTDTIINHTDCPKCGRGSVYLYNKVAKCNNADCNLILYRHLCGKIITDVQFLTILEGGTTEIIKGFANIKGRRFRAALHLDENFKIKMKFLDEEN